MYQQTEGREGREDERRENVVGEGGENRGEGSMDGYG